MLVNVCSKMKGGRPSSEIDCCSSWGERKSSPSWFCWSIDLFISCIIDLLMPVNSLSEECWLAPEVAHLRQHLLHEENKPPPGLHIWPRPALVTSSWPGPLHPRPHPVLLRLLRYDKPRLPPQPTGRLAGKVTSASFKERMWTQGVYS